MRAMQAHAGLLILLATATATLSTTLPAPSCNGSRVPPQYRRFNSSAVDGLINQYKPRFISRNISRLFENCLPNCLDSTIVHASPEDTFVITGELRTVCC